MLTRLLPLLLVVNSYAIETRIKIGIIDTGIKLNSNIMPFLCEDGLKDFTNTGIHDTVGHGTNIAGIILDGLSPADYCLVVIKYKSNDQYLAALEYASKKQLKFVNLSLSGTSAMHTEKRLLNKMGTDKTVITVAAGNDSLNLSKLCPVYPACYGKSIPYMFVVGARDHIKSNYKGPVNTYELGRNVCGLGICLSGTSQATAVFMNKLIRSGRYLAGGNTNESTTKETNRN